MKVSKMVLMSIMVCLPGLSLADEAASIRFSGDAQAKQVCKAVVRDDVKMLRRALRSYQSTLVFDYAHDRGGRDIAQDFTCNNMDLQEFSNHVGAIKVSGYFANDTGADKAQVAAVGN